MKVQIPCLPVGVGEGRNAFSKRESRTSSQRQSHMNMAGGHTFLIFALIHKNMTWKTWRMGG